MLRTIVMVAIEEINSLRDWMDKEYTRDLPVCKYVLRRGVDGSPQIDEHGQHIYQRKKVIIVCLRRLYILMRMPVEDGGFAGAYDPDRSIQFSQEAFLCYLPNRLDVNYHHCNCDECYNQLQTECFAPNYAEEIPEDEENVDKNSRDVE